MYTTFEAEQPEEKLVRVLTNRTKKACTLPREHGPVNWFEAPLDSHGTLLGFPWDLSSLKKFAAESLRALGGQLN